MLNANMYGFVREEMLLNQIDKANWDFVLEPGLRFGDLEIAPILT